MDESLNIEYHVRRLVLIAISKHRTKEQAAQALGISVRTLYWYQKKFNYSKHNDDISGPEHRQ